MNCAIKRLKAVIVGHQGDFEESTLLHLQQLNVHLVKKKRRLIHCADRRQLLMGSLCITFPES